MGFSMTNFPDLIKILNSYVWGYPLLILLIFVGIYLTIRTKGVQFRYLLYANRLAFTRSDDSAQGDISHFQALMTALAATIGIGSITGVATAIAIGGVGSIFWMWVAASLGMATKYAEAVLAIKYRSVDENGSMCGGPMHYLEKGKNLKILAVLFAVFGSITAIGTGNMIQSNSVASALEDLIGAAPVYTGLVLMLLTGIALFGGIKSIGKVTSILVPTMAIFYILGGFIIIFYEIQNVPAAFRLIFLSAFKGQAALGGFAGATVMQAIAMGISRGVFSSEAGLGSSPIAAAAAKTDTPPRQALISMCSVFITTGIVCTVTALVIILTGQLGQTGVDGKLLNGSALVLKAFNVAIPKGGLIVTIALIPFAFSTTLGWAYYGEKCVEYLFGVRSIWPYRLIYTLLVLPGAILSVELIWDIANLLNGLMAFPNLIGLFFLGSIVAKETKAFDHLRKREKQKAL